MRTLYTEYSSSTLKENTCFALEHSEPKRVLQALRVNIGINQECRRKAITPN